MTSKTAMTVAALAGTVVGGHVQRCGLLECACADGERGSQLGRSAVRPSITDEWPAPQIVYDVLRSPGVPLGERDRAFFERRFGHDFSNVRVHTGASAAESARAVGAAGYTVGRQVVFGEAGMALDSRMGQRLLAHELRHVIQQETVASAAPATSLVIGPEHNNMETEAAADGAAVNDAFAGAEAGGRDGVSHAANSLVQRFSSAEHRQIGELAYDQARSDAPRTRTSEPSRGSKVAHAPVPTTSGGPGDPKAKEYGALVAAADNFASLDELERHEAGAASLPVPIVGKLWDFLDDKTRYLDLASRNIQHFHPHNFLAWQRWHWHALALMNDAYRQEQLAKRLLAQRKELSWQFDTHRDRARAAFGKTGVRAERTAQEQVAQMGAVLARMQQTESSRQAALADAGWKSREAVRTNAFGDHFLTDAFAGGHIVTPRAEVLHEYATRLLGLVPVGPLLHCGNVPSLAWHDLDNKFGVPVTSRRGASWIAFGDNYAHCRDVVSCQSRLPTGASLSPTLANAVAATAASIRQLWQAASGRRPADLSAVLDFLPRPDLDNYPRWSRQQWDLQLRHAAGVSLQPAHEEMSAATIEGRRTTPSPGPQEAPNPKGEALGSGVLSFGATCLNALHVFSYDRLVIPMIARIRQTQRDRFYYAGQGQMLAPGSQPESQPHAGGHVALGSVLGALFGAGIGLLVGGVIGAVVGGGLGLLVGGLLGGLL
jgi:hypothetical protein